ncbi:MAG TPA: ABC transporter permease, partial [Steroidobacteraceae bacterium]|nr:ABC transporter permease [Steroidobacteraceae bacterium]
MSATPAAATATDRRSRARSWWQQLSAVMIKEAKQVTRDPSSWIIAVVLPLTFLFLFGYGISLDTTVVKIAVVREDDSRDAQDLAAALTHSKWFLVVPAVDRRAGERLLQDQNVKAVVLIPAEFGRMLHAEDTTAQVQVLVDGAEPNTANFVHGYVSAVWSDFLASRAMQQ